MFKQWVNMLVPHGIVATKTTKKPDNMINSTSLGSSINNLLTDEADDTESELSLGFSLTPEADGERAEMPEVLLREEVYESMQNASFHNSNNDKAVSSDNHHNRTI